MTNRIK